MIRRTTYADLVTQLDRLNTASKVATLPQYQLDAGPQGKYRLVDHKGRGILGADTGLGIAAIPKGELLQRMEDFTLGIELAYLAVGRRDRTLQPNNT
jgi:hypothetical protein